jgi:nitrogen regulatory protein PII
MNGSLPTVYSHGKLVLAVVERGLGERLVAFTKRAGARGGTILPGRGTAETALLELLGIGDTLKDVVLTIVTDDQFDPIMNALHSIEPSGKHGAGLVMVLDLSRILTRIAAGTGAESIQTETRTPAMQTETYRELIVFILNRGFADDAMAAARKAGAAGGTVLNARGTGKEEDVKFFGITLVPEKEILLILVESDKTDTILEAVGRLPFLAEPGSGIAFTLGVEEAFRLGKLPGR